MENKHNSLNLAAKICSDICPWTLSVPRASLLGTDNVRGQISEHIFAPNEGYCLFNELGKILRLKIVGSVVNFICPVDESFN